jgi:hypothetical protein
MPNQGRSYQYVMLLSHSDYRVLEISEITQGLKAIAKEPALYSRV